MIHLIPTLSLAKLNSNYENLRLLFDNYKIHLYKLARIHVLKSKRSKKTTVKRSLFIESNVYLDMDNIKFYIILNPLDNSTWATLINGKANLIGDTYNHSIASHSGILHHI